MCVTYVVRQNTSVLKVQSIKLVLVGKSELRTQKMIYLTQILHFISP